MEAGPDGLARRKKPGNRANLPPHWEHRRLPCTQPGSRTGNPANKPGLAWKLQANRRPTPPDSAAIPRHLGLILPSGILPVLSGARHAARREQGRSTHGRWLQPPHPAIGDGQAPTFGGSPADQIAATMLPPELAWHVVLAVGTVEDGVLEPLVCSAVREDATPGRSTEMQVRRSRRHVNQSSPPASLFLRARRRPLSSIPDRYEVTHGSISVRRTPIRLECVQTACIARM